MNALHRPWIALFGSQRLTIFDLQLDGRRLYIVLYLHISLFLMEQDQWPNGYGIAILLAADVSISLVVQVHPDPFFLIVIRIC